jgi:hypothetical protein
VTNHRSLLERLAELDPAPPERISEVARDEDRLRAEITSTLVDELASRRGLRGRRVMTAVAAAIVAIGLIVPIAILLPLAGNDATDPRGSGAEPPVTASDRIEVLAPTPDAAVSSPVVVRGTADVFEATVSIRILDGMNNVIADTFTTATCGSGCRGDFEAEVSFSVGAEQPGVIQVFELSPEDDSKAQMVRIPVTLVPSTEDPIAAEVERVWYDGDRAVPTEGDEPLELAFHEGPDHCGWTSVTFLHTAWPLGSQAGRGDPWRQYLRDPQAVLAEHLAVPFDPDAELPTDAVQSRYASGTGWFLWTAPSDEDVAVYLVNPGRGITERWARAPEPALCA